MELIFAISFDGNCFEMIFPGSGILSYEPLITYNVHAR